MDNKRFVDEIYKPYADCWQIMKTIQNKSCRDNDWSDWDKALRDFTKEHDNPYGHILARMLTDVGDIIAKMNGEEIV